MGEWKLWRAERMERGGNKKGKGIFVGLKLLKVKNSGYVPDA